MMGKLNGCFFNWRWWMLFMITIWDRANADIKTEFDSEHVYNKYYFKTEIKSHGDEVTDIYY